MAKAAALRMGRLRDLGAGLGSSASAAAAAAAGSSSIRAASSAAGSPGFSGFSKTFMIFATQIGLPNPGARTRANWPAFGRPFRE